MSAWQALDVPTNVLVAILGHLEVTSDLQLQARLGSVSKAWSHTLQSAPVWQQISVTAAQFEHPSFSRWAAKRGQSIEQLVIKQSETPEPVAAASLGIFALSTEAQSANRQRTTPSSYKPDAHNDASFLQQLTKLVLFADQYGLTSLSDIVLNLPSSVQQLLLSSSGLPPALSCVLMARPRVQYSLDHLTTLQVLRMHGFSTLHDLELQGIPATLQSLHIDPDRPCCMPELCLTNLAATAASAHGSAAVNADAQASAGQQRTNSGRLHCASSSTVTVFAKGWPGLGLQVASMTGSFTGLKVLHLNSVVGQQQHIDEIFNASPSLSELKLTVIQNDLKGPDTSVVSLSGIQKLTELSRLALTADSVYISGASSIAQLPQLTKLFMEVQQDGVVDFSQLRPAQQSTRQSAEQSMSQSAEQSSPEAQHQIKHATVIMSSVFDVTACLEGLQLMQSVDTLDVALIDGTYRGRSELHWAIKQGSLLSRASKLEHLRVMCQSMAIEVLPASLRTLHVDAATIKVADPGRMLTSLKAVELVQHGAGWAPTRTKLVIVDGLTAIR